MKKTTAILLTAIITTSSYVVFANEGILSSTESPEASASPTSIVTVEEFTEGEVDGHIVLTEDELAEIVEEIAIVEDQLKELEDSVDAIKEDLEELKNVDEDKDREIPSAIKYSKLTKKLSQLESLLAKMQVVYAKVPTEAKPAIEAKIKKTELRINNIKAILATTEETKVELAPTVEATSNEHEVSTEAFKKSIMDIKNELKELKKELKECKEDIKSLNKELKEYKKAKDSKIKEDKKIIKEEKKTNKEDKLIIKEDIKNNSSQGLLKANEAKAKASENKGNEESKGNKKGIQRR